MAESGTFTVNGKAYSLPADLTMGEMCDAERYFGVEFGNAATSGARMAAALIWIAVHRDDPTVSPEEIRDLPSDVFATFGADAGPPAVENSAAAESSGDSSSNATDDQDATPEATGLLGSAMSSRSDLATSQT